MANNSTVKIVLRFIAKHMIIGLIASGSVLIICYLIGKTSPKFMSDVLTYVGAAIIAVGVCGIFGTQKTGGDLYHYQNVRTVQNTDSQTRLNQDFKLINDAYAFTIKALIVSVIPFISSVIISKSFH